MKNRWMVLLFVALLGTAGCQNCGQAARQAEEEAARIAAEAAAAAEREVAEAQATGAQDADREAAEAAAAAEREAAEAAARAAAEAQRNHSVVNGDCLWYIAADRYDDGQRWGEIYEANRSQISDPDVIYPGQVLTIPPA